MRAFHSVEPYTNPMKTPKEPLVKMTPEMSWDDFARSGFSNATLKGNPQAKIVIREQTIDTVIFEGVDFAALDLAKVDFRNVLFRQCTFVNLDFSDRYFGRIRFEGCNLMGTKWIKAALYDVVFQDGNLAYANFSSSSLKTAAFAHCSLKESFFAETEFKDVSFDDSTLSGAEFFKTSLSGIDLSSDVVEGLHCEKESLQGAIIAPSQAIDFIAYLGLKIKDK